MSIGAGLTKFFVFLVEFMPTIVEAFYEKHPELRETPPPPDDKGSDADAARDDINKSFRFSDEAGKFVPVVDPYEAPSD